ncbi:MAG: glycosyltransferase [Ruminococcus sp.]|nr:glycosyltransferase [Ruminococcus sp.]
MRIIERLCNKLKYCEGKCRVRRVRKQRIKNGINLEEDRQEKIIVSLTSYGERVKTVYLCIKSLMLQTVKPDKIILYLGTDVTKDQLNEELLSLCKYGLEIRYNCCDIKPHKKYYFSMQEFPDDIVITVDDDVVYEKSLIKSLLKGSEKFPKAVICKRARIITRDENGELLPYAGWALCNDRKMKERMDLLPTGAGGVLYPPKSISSEAFNIEKINKYGLYADDIWLKLMEVKAGTPVVFVKPMIDSLAETPNSQANALNKENVDHGQNDYYISELEKLFQIKIG